MNKELQIFNHPEFGSVRVTDIVIRDSRSSVRKMRSLVTRA